MGKRDENQEAARIVSDSTKRHEAPLPADVEAAWETWSAGIQGCDERTMTLLRAAFEAGASAARVTNAAAELGRRGGAKGGPARAKKLSKTRRQEIARKAAESRWKEREKKDSR